MSLHHPIRDAEIRIFKSVNDDEHVGRLKPYDTWPILFFGRSEDDVRQQMEFWIANVIAKNEATSIARQEALAKAREARAARKEVSA